MNYMFQCNDENYCEQTNNGRQHFGVAKVALHNSYIVMSVYIAVKSMRIYLHNIFVTFATI